MKVAIKDIAYYLPERIVTNDELQKQNPSWNMSRIEERVGVRKRHISHDDETALDLSLRACNKLFSTNGDLKEKIDGKRAEHV